MAREYFSSELLEFGKTFNQEIKRNMGVICGELEAEKLSN